MYLCNLCAFDKSEFSKGKKRNVRTRETEREREKYNLLADLWVVKYTLIARMEFK